MKAMTEPVIGVDEAGRGAWAGPFYAVAVRLRNDWSNIGLKDSKKLTPAQREQLAQYIQESADADVGIGIVEPADIDKNGLTATQQVAMRQAVEQLQPNGETIIVDGHINYLQADYQYSRAIIRADNQHLCVMAAAIVAKYLRDLFMIQQTIQYPQYAFERHKGYGTALHRDRLQEHGTCSLHRLSYKPVRPFTRS